MNKNAGTPWLPRDIRIILSQHDSVNEAARFHDEGYLKQELSRKKYDEMFRDHIERGTGKPEVAQVYYKWIRRTGWFQWYIIKFKKYIKGLFK